MDKPVHWVPGIRDRVRQLEAIGVSSVYELYSDVPRELLLDRAPSVGFGRMLSEEELRRLSREISSSNTVFTGPPPFTGGGWCPHWVPSIVDYIVSRGEFLTAYTPYQPEINQGLLQALFEYQSLIADLTELEIVNASLYDGSTAAAEAALMALRVTRRKKIVLSSTLHPEYIDVIKTWLYGKGVEIRFIPRREDTYQVDTESLDEHIDSNTAAVIVASPNFYGAFERDIGFLADQVHHHGGLLVQVFEPLSLGIVKPPGRLGVDIAVAEGQPLGLGMNYGGPGLGIMAVRWDRKLLRQVPGRIIGLTRDAEGERAFTMILQAREQHIRREKATSNITTNESLMAIRAAIYLTLLGGEGLRRLARSIWLRSHYLAKRLREVGVEAPVYSSEFFKEFLARFQKPYAPIHRELLRRGILGGLDVSRYGAGSGREAIFCATEVHSKKDIDTLINTLVEIMG